MDIQALISQLMIILLHIEMQFCLEMSCQKEDPRCVMPFTFRSSRVDQDCSYGRAAWASGALPECFRSCAEDPCCRGYELDDDGACRHTSIITDAYMFVKDVEGKPHQLCMEGKIK